MKEKILNLLKKDARLSASEIADRLATDVATVTGIIDECEKGKTIYGYCALVNEEAFDKPPVRALIEVSVQPERDDGFDNIARKISKFTQVSDVMLVSGNYDLQLIVVGDSLQDIAGFVSSKLAPMDGVTSTRTHFMLKKYKECGFTAEDEEDYERLSVTP